jgi:hypothetical protein
METAAVVPPFSFERDEAHRQMMARRYLPAFWPSLASLPGGAGFSG